MSNQKKFGNSLGAGRWCLFAGVASPVPRVSSVAHYWRGATSASVWELALVVQT